MPGVADRFAEKYAVDGETGCWLWQAYIRPDGYGTFMVAGKNFRAHRWSYEQFAGPIADGLVIDHLCRNRSCVNPEHLEPVTSFVNTIERGMGQRAVTYRERRCKRGHELTEDNLYRSPTNSAVRQCISCRKLREQSRAPRRTAA
jgi:hypothetical protein